jgi:hyperosmotically inducible protein
MLVVIGLSLASVEAEDKTVGDHVDDGWLHTKVKTAMVGHGSSDVNVEVYHGVVQLAGFLTGENNKKNIIDSAQSVKGVKRISDQLHLVKGDRSAGQVVDDNTLTAKVKGALVDGELASINVEVNRGNVLLSGFVDSDEVRDRAIKMIERLERVVSVIDGMDLKP